MREKKDELPIYTSHPPQWLPKIHASADLGYPGFHPPRPGQDEDVLTKASIQSGHTLSQPVTVETFSVNAIINEKLQAPEALTKLEQLMNEVFIRRADDIPSIPAPSFRMPTRVTLNDSKRDAWFDELANPDVPLQKLGKSVPHGGAKGQALLDSLYAKNVSIPRAVWFLRVSGANETAGLRNRPSYVPTQYSIEWTNVVTGYLKARLNEIVLPISARIGITMKHTFKGVLAEPESRERWMSRFIYCVKLVRAFYAEDLVDKKTFLIWLVQLMAQCTLVQAGFALRLCDEYFDDVVTSRALTKCFVEGIASKLYEIRTSDAQTYLPDTEELLLTLLQRAVLAQPDSLVNSKLWITYGNLLRITMSEPVAKAPTDRAIEQNLRSLRHLVNTNLDDIERRNEALLFRCPLAPVSCKLNTAVSNVKLLNSISSDTDMRSISYFNTDVHDPEDFKERLDMLLTWSVTPLQYGDHRPFAAVTIIRLWLEKACDRANRRDMATPTEFLQDQLFDWLDCSNVAGDPNNIRDISLLYGKLVKHEVYSYAKYIQRLIARNERGINLTETHASRHRLFLNWIPLFNCTTSLSNQRKVALYGVRVRETPEELIERDIRKELRVRLLPLFDEGSISESWTINPECTALVNATRFVQVRTFRTWLLPVFKNRLTSEHFDRSLLFQCYLVTVELMHSAKCYHSLLDLTLLMLHHCDTPQNMNSLVATLERYSLLWTCMDILPTIVAALDAAHQAWKVHGTQSRSLLLLLLKFDNNRYLSPISRDQIMSDVASFELALRPPSNDVIIVPSLQTEILWAVNAADENATSELIKSLWLKYRSTPEWGWRVWEGVLVMLDQLPAMLSDESETQMCATRLASLLCHTDQHLPNGLDENVRHWFLGPGGRGLRNLDHGRWDLFIVMILQLVVQGALKSTTLLEGIVYPAWNIGASASAPLTPPDEMMIRSANDLFSRLILQETPSSLGIPPTDLFEMQYIRTRRQVVFDEPQFRSLSANIPALLALEDNEMVSESLRKSSTSLRCQLCQHPDFRRGAYRNLDDIRERFENSSYLVGSEQVSKRAIAGLKMIICDSSSDANVYDWPDVTSLLSPWKIAATTIQMQLQVKQLGRALSQPSTAVIATENLNKLTSMLFRHTKSAEEASHVAEMVRGADAIIATKFISNGFTCITQLLASSPPHKSIAGDDCHVQQLLRVLIYVAQPFRHSTSTLPLVDGPCHEAFISAVETKLKLFEPAVRTADPSPSAVKDLILLCRLLQFVLSFRAHWTLKAKTIGSGLTSFIFNLSLHCAREDSLNINLYPILIDTLLALLDELPHDSKTLPFDPYRYYPDTPPEKLPPDLPTEYRKQLVTLLAKAPFDSIVSSLVHSHRESNGTLVNGEPVQNRPWEWIEHLGDSPLTESKEEEREQNERSRNLHTVKNSGSIPLEHFGARLTGDNIKHPMVHLDPQTECAVRTFEDGFSESVFTRDWYETRVALEPTLPPDFILARPYGEHRFQEFDVDVKPSPVSSGGDSRPSTQLSKRVASPGHSAGTASTTHDIIDVDSIPTTSSTRREPMDRKRKQESVSDDEIEIVEGPYPSRPGGSSSKKQKTGKPTAGKTRASKKK